jgi:hypothetical protein
MSLLVFGVFVLGLGLLAGMMGWLGAMGNMTRGFQRPLEEGFDQRYRSHGRMMLVMGLGSFGVLIGLGLIVAHVLLKFGII